MENSKSPKRKEKGNLGGDRVASRDCFFPPCVFLTTQAYATWGKKLLHRCKLSLDINLKMVWFKEK